MKLKKLLIICLSIAIIVSFTPASFAMEKASGNAGGAKGTVIDRAGSEQIETPLKGAGGSYDIEIGGYIIQSDATDMLIKFNNYRYSIGLDPLTWDNYDEDYLLDRAAELSIKYSFTRLDGSAGDEWVHGRYDSMASFAGEWIDDAWYNENDPLNDPELISVCAGTFKTYDGDKYIAISFYYDKMGGNTPLYDDDEYTFSLNAKDGYLNCEAYFMDSNLRDISGKGLSIGKKYNYWIFNYNESVNNRVVVFDTQYSHSSNTAVATIDKYGIIKTKRAGTAKITVKPAAASGISFTENIVVKPNKTKSVKATSPKTKKIKVSWAKQSGVSGYQIYRSTKKSSGFKCVKTITSGSTKTYTDKSVKKGKTYYYKVRAYVKYSSKKYPGAYSTVVKCKSK